jgi:hypothetical protein
MAFLYKCRRPSTTPLLLLLLQLGQQQGAAA